MFFITKETSKELFNKVINLWMLTYLIGAECSSEAIIRLFIVKTGLNLLDKVLNTQFLFHFRRNLRNLFLILAIVITASSVRRFRKFLLSLAELLIFALFIHLFAEGVYVLIRLNVPPNVIAILSIIIDRQPSFSAT